MEFRPQGLICAPRSAPEITRTALRHCPLPLEELATVPGWPQPAAAVVAGWYRRGPRHAPAPPGVRELVQVDGEGFGPAGHATTAMCLALLRLMPPGPALDAGCGSGLLSQAWAASGYGPVVGCDLDGHALTQAHDSAAIAGLDTLIEFRRIGLERIDGRLLRGRVLLANVPVQAHRALIERIAEPPPGVVLSGLRVNQVGAIVDRYRALGLRQVRLSYAGRFCASALVRG